MQSILKKPGPFVMGILNVTPDSFSDGGRFSQYSHALKHAEQMVKDGADIIDIGGESTRPGAEPVSVEQELERVIPLLESMKQLGIAVSVDTSKPQVMDAAINSGASMINDVRALRVEGALEVVANSNVDVCLMHMQGQPRHMQIKPCYGDVVIEVSEFLKSRVEACLSAGITKERICLDPGVGFGKALEHNCELLKNISSFNIDEIPILIGVSRKRMFYEILGLDIDQRMTASVAAGLIAVTKGAKILRVHDVKATKEAIEVYKVIEQH